MGFKHTIDGTEYEVLSYEIDSEGNVTDWVVLHGLQELPYDHMAKAIQKELEKQCRLDADATEKDAAMFSAECQAATV